jgi:hypothetical protein
VRASISAEKRTFRLESSGVVGLSEWDSNADVEEGRGREADLRGPIGVVLELDDGIAAVFNDNVLATACWGAEAAVGNIIVEFMGSEVGRG